MWDFKYFEWQVIKALLALTVFCTGMCAVFQLPLFSYFLAPVVTVVVVIWMRKMTNTPASTAIEKQDWKMVIEICESEIAKDPNDANAQANYALALTNLFRFEEAVERIKIAIALNAELKFCYFLKGNANTGIHNYAEAIEDFSKSIELGFNEPVIRLLRSIALTSEYQYEEALRDLDSLLESSPKLPVTKLYKAFTLQKMCMNEEASKLCNEAFPKISKEELPFGLLVRSLINARLGKLDEAVNDMKQMLDLMPRKQECFLDLAYLYGRLGALKESQANLDKVEPQNDYEEAALCMQKSRLCLQEKDEKGALKLAERSLEKRPGQADMRAIYGLTLVRNGRYDEARRELDAAIKADPCCDEAYWYRGELYERIGDEEKAKQDKKVATDYGYIPYL